MAAAAAWCSLSRGVRRAALELRQWSERGAASLAPDEDELEAVERQLDVGPTSVRSPVKRKAKLPESYEMLCEFFNCFESSTQLLRMKGSKASFPNICATTQHLSERKPQSIDVALLWPGRFVLCDFPGWHECLEILEVHSREVSLASDASLEDVASLTERFTGADPSLASLVHMPVVFSKNQLLHFTWLVYNSSVRTVRQPLKNLKDSSYTIRMFIPAHVYQ
ncbi:hypothetical protein OsJ_00658 [Oryza sativa Japonica Group]|uniref:Uncharacterized protein n=2 Tax=Oryza TaxID=4527 RepID=A2ZQ25_ORYSJ|nr:hypothetical protein OsJ_00658 [Oryza sativa Japonica Group]